VPPIEMLPDLFFFQRGYLNANHFALRSDSPVLIDTAYLADWEETERILASVGVDSRRVDRIITTHCHCDHIGGHQLVQQRSGCDIAVHRIGKHFMDTGDDWSPWWRYFQQKASFFDATVALEDGDRVAVGRHEFTVVHTPGHAADHTVLYHPKERLLISSDLLWESDMAVINLRVEGSAAVFTMLSSLDRIASLEVRRVYPGHGRPFSDFQAALHTARKRLEGYLDRPQLIGRDLLKKIIVYTLMMRGAVPEHRFFPDLMKTHWFPETVDFYFDGAYRESYDDVLSGFLRRGIVMREYGKLHTTVKP